MRTEFGMTNPSDDEVDSFLTAHPHIDVFEVLFRGMSGAPHG